MNGNVLVIGNGFDLAHGIPTKYEHFISYIKNKDYLSDAFLPENEKEELLTILETNGFLRYFYDYNEAVPGWVDFEHEILKITNEFAYLFNNCSSLITRSNTLNIKTASELLTDILQNFEIATYKDGFYVINPVYHTSKYGLNKPNILRTLKHQLNTLIRALEIYLLRCQRAFFANDKSKVIQQINTLKPQYLISFNYTETYKLYDIPSSDIFHIHGKLKTNNMVLGFDDYNPGNLDFVYFKKYFQRIQKLTGYIDTNKMMRYKSGYPIDPVIHFYGHSMDKTDGDIIQELKSIAKEFIIYTYDQEDYEQKVINLIDIFGKDSATKMIQTKFIKFVPCE